MDRMAAAVLIVIAALVMSGAFPARGFTDIAAFSRGNL